MIKRLLKILLSIVTILSLFGCAGDPFDDLYVSNVYPGTTNTYDLGTAALVFDNIFVNNINGAAFTGASKWTADANGINYSLGSVGINTPSELDKLLMVYSNDGVKNNPVLHVGDNSASATGTGQTISMAGAKTGHSYGLRINNAATSATGGVNKYGIYVGSSSGWTGVASTNYGLYIAKGAGAGNNVGAFIDDPLDMSDEKVNNIGTLNLTDPTELTIAAGVITKTQGFHTVDTEGDAATDDLNTINGGAIGDILTISGANDAREIKVTRTGNIRFQPDHLIEGFGFVSPTGSSGTYYTGGFYAAPAADANLTNAAPTVTYGTANSPHGTYMFLVAAAAGTTNAGTVSIVISGTTITSAGVRVAADTETLVADITTMGANQYYQTTKRWLGTVTYTLTGAGGAAVFAADFNYGKASYDSLDERMFNVKLIEVFGRAGANDTGFDIQVLHHKTTGWTYSAAAFVPGTTPISSLVTDYATDNDLVTNERFTWDRELNLAIDGTNNEGFLIRVVTTANKAVEFMNVSVYVEAVPNDKHLKTTGQAISLLYNGTNWMEN